MKIAVRNIAGLGVILGLLGIAGTLAADTAKSAASAIHPRALAAAKQMSRAEMTASYLKIPLSFERNEGQTATQVKFLSRGAGYELFLTPAEAVLALTKPAVTSDEGAASADASGAPRTAAVLRLSLAGANPNPQIEGTDQLAGKVNYLIGNDSAKWHKDIPTFAQVKYDGVYPGIDLVYHGSNQRQLEYDFQVAPGADPRKIELGFAGIKRLTIDKDGELILHLADGEVTEHVPAVYQEIGGHRRPIAGAYAMHGADRVGFAVAAYDRTKPLIIDPVLVYSTYLGGSIFDVAAGIAADTAGSAYVTGFTSSSNFPTTAGAYRTTEPNSLDAFVTKFNPTGTGLVYSTYLGGSGGVSEGLGIAVDGSGSAYVTGFTWAPNFPTTPGAFQDYISGLYTYRCGDGGAPSKPGANSKPGKAGSRHRSRRERFARKAHRAARHQAKHGNHAAATASAGGKLAPAEFPPSPDFPGSGSSGPCYGGAEDAFVTKLTPNGSGLVYSTFLGGINHDRGYAIALNAAGNAYVTGFTKSYDFPTTAGAFQPQAGFAVAGCYTYACQNGFVTELTADGSNLVYSTYLGGNNDDSDDFARAIAVDPAGDAYVAGDTESIFNASCTGLFDPSNCCSGFATGYCVGFPTTPGAYQTEVNPYTEDNAYVTKLNAAGTGLVYSTLLGGGTTPVPPEEPYPLDLAHGIAIDANGDAYVVGKTTSGDFPTTTGSFEPTPPGYCQGGFLSEFNPTASTLLYSTFIGSLDGCDKYASSIAVDPLGDVFVGGRDDDASFPITTNAACTGPGMSSYGVPFACCTGSGTGTCSTIQGTFGGDRDGYLLEFMAAPGGTPPLNAEFSTYVGGAGVEQTNGVALDPAGDVYLTGLTYSSNFPASAGAFQANQAGIGNAFVQKIGCMATGTATIFTSNYNQTITIFPPGSNCSAPPSATIAGTLTGLSYPFGLAYDTGNGDLYVINYGGASVSVYSMAQWQAGGNQTPIAMISGPKTKLAGALGIAVDSASGDVYVANSAGGTSFSGSITMYKNSTIVAGGNKPPDAIITGSNTNLYSPQGVAIDPNTGNIFVANLGGPIGTNGDGSVTEYAAGASGNQSPAAMIVGSMTGLSQPSGIAVDASSNIYVANYDGGPSASGAVTIYTQPLTSKTGNPNNVAPAAEIVGPQTGKNYTLLNDINGIAVDANGLIYVSNFGETGSVTVYPPLAALTGAANYPNVSPVVDITGPATLLYGPRGIAVDPPPALTRRQRRRRKHRR
ncbi:MAG: SBBP repeat-containing protein [Candidatus Binataceae bacterium]